MTSELSSIRSNYSGQMLWAFCYEYPYWPSIVCASDSGEILNEKNSRSTSVHVKLCVNRKSCWVSLENVFEFNGYESFVAKKRSMKSKLSVDDFNKAFDTESNESWRKAVVEGLFIMGKDLDSRLIIFDTLNVVKEINSEINKIASTVNFEEANTEPLQTAEPLKRRSTRLSQSNKLPSKVQEFKSQSNQKEQSKPQEATVPEKRLTRRSLSQKKLHSGKLTKFNDFEKALLTYKMESYPKEILFQGSSNGSVCKICCSKGNQNDGNLVKCSTCGDHVHSVCLNKNSEESFIKLPEEFDPTVTRKRYSIRIRIEVRVFCNECSSSPLCFACKEASSATDLNRCDVKACARYYHTDCLDDWKQIEIIDSKLKCPVHVCHTCFSIKSDRATVTTKFTFCIKCPTAYHRHSCCIPAGTIILTQKQHICIRHRVESRSTLPNLDWCARCGKEGDALICCGSCPKTYHISCLDSSEVSDRFLCKSCVNGMNPLYGQMIVAKYGEHPWWPAVVVPSFKIPSHMYDKPPNNHEFCIRFFGDYRFAWIGRSSVHFYSKSDANKFLINDLQQTNAFMEAANWFDRFEKRDNKNNEIIDSETNKMLPDRQEPKYIKIDTIKVVPPAKLVKSNYEPCECSCGADDLCGPTSNCENRELYIECDPMHCPSGSKCKNQCFERKVQPAVKVVFIDEKKGFGLIADEFIYAGTFVKEYVGELITNDELQRRKSRKQRQGGSGHYYFMSYSKGMYIDAEKKGNESRFVNHSCNPNCETQKWTVNKLDRIGYFALKDIEKGTELTTNYDFDRGDFHECFCGERNCKGVIGKQKS